MKFSLHDTLFFGVQEKLGGNKVSSLPLLGIMVMMKLKRTCLARI